MLILHKNTHICTHTNTQSNLSVAADTVNGKQCKSQWLTDPGLGTTSTPNPSVCLTPGTPPSAKLDQAQLQSAYHAAKSS